jgi:hypothetical protein
MLQFVHATYTHTFRTPVTIHIKKNKILFESEQERRDRTNSTAQ